MELGDREKTDPRGETVVWGVGHVRVRPVETEGGFAFYHGGFELGLVADEKYMGTGLQNERIVRLEGIAPYSSLAIFHIRKRMNV